MEIQGSYGVFGIFLSYSKMISTHCHQLPQRQSRIGYHRLTKLKKTMHGVLQKVVYGSTFDTRKSHGDANSTTHSEGKVTYGSAIENHGPILSKQVRGSNQRPYIRQGP